MRDYLFIGTSAKLPLDSTLRKTCSIFAQKGYQAAPDDLIAQKVGIDKSEVPPHASTDGDFCVEIFFKNAATNITISLYETEVIPGYSLITEPFTVCVSVWTGAEAIYKTLTACVALAVALISGGKIVDSEHKWSSKDLNEPDDFMERVKGPES